MLVNPVLMRPTVDQTKEEKRKMRKMRKHQEIIGECYDRWKDHNAADPVNAWSFEDFWDQLSSKERFAISTGKLNQQVENGGFLQWYHNGYGIPDVVTYLLRVLPRVKTASSLKVEDLLRQYNDAVELYDENEDKENEYGGMNQVVYGDFSKNLDSLDTLYYTVNEQFMADVQHSLDTGSWKGGKVT